jgi:hypothetical protein
MSLTRTDRVRGALYGLLVGDALGVPYEFNPPQRHPSLHEIDCRPVALASNGCTVLGASKSVVNGRKIRHMRAAIACR